MYRSEQRAVPVPVPAPDAPRVVQALRRLEKALDSCHMTAISIQSAADRITGPGPRSGDSATSGQTPPPSIEQLIELLVGSAEGLHSRLVEANNQLNGAV
jgi:hypothetical protein